MSSDPLLAALHATVVHRAVLAMILGWRWI